MRYRVHGLTVASNRPIPELIPTGAGLGADLTIHFGESPVEIAEAADADPWFEGEYQDPAGRPILVATRRNGGRWRQFAYADGPVFLVDAAATSIWVTWPADLTIHDTIEYLLGPVMGIVLRLRGHLCLHASAVVAGGAAFTFAGPAGAGKSTMAAAFAAAGRPVLSDDTVTVTRSDRGWMAAPAYPRLRLWPDSASAVGDRRVRTRAPFASPADTRHEVDLVRERAFSDEPGLLRVVYLLEFDEEAARPRIEALRPVEALPVLAAQTFARRVLDREGRAREFALLGDLVAEVPVRRLARPADFGALTRVCEAVLADVGAGTVV